MTTANGLDVFAQPEHPGLVYGLDEQVYHSGRNSLSYSGAKLLLPPNAPALFKYRLDNPRPYNRTFEIGLAAHRKVLGVGADVEIVQAEARDECFVDADDYRTAAAKEHRDAIRASGRIPVLAKDVAATGLGANEVIVQRTGWTITEVDATSYNSTAAQQHRDMIRAAGKTPLLRSEAKQIDEMAEALLANPEAAVFFEQDGHAEVSGYFIDETTGILRRNRFDWLPNPDGSRLVIPDYKSAISSDESRWSRDAAKFRYDMQDDWYRDTAIHLELDDDPAFAFIVQEKEPPYLTAVYQLDADARLAGRKSNRRALEIYARCRDTGVWPGRRTNLQLALPTHHILEHAA